MRRLIAGTRGSELALWQTRHVAALLAPTEVAERIITTRGDVNQTGRLTGKLEKGLFTEELEAALLAGQIDWAVHSLKDLPTRMPLGIVVGATLRRAPPGDLLILQPSAVGEGLLPVRAGASIGSCSLRREALLGAYAPKCTAVALRGNVPTRLEKLRSGKYDGIILAEAGVTRLKLSLDGLAVFQLNPKRWTCAPGQGAIAVQCRATDHETRALLSKLDDRATAAATSLERDFLRMLEGGCTTPFGAYVEAGKVWLGLATEAGWKTRVADVPVVATPEWLQSELEHLKLEPSLENSNDWLARRL